jgi:carbohydrate kinase (thermoresistant glucokinase family)
MHSIRAAVDPRRGNGQNDAAGATHSFNGDRTRLEQALRDRDKSARVAVVMGVSGAGKTTVARALAQRLGWQFVDGDALHPPENVAKMKAGHPLDDADREPWLAAIAAQIDRWRRQGECGIVTCSALKRRYRDAIVGARPDVRLIYLDGGRALIASRLAGRHDHFMPTSLLDSQFAALEPPGPDERPIAVSIDRPIEAIVDALVIALTPSGCDNTEAAPAAAARSNRSL